MSEDTALAEPDTAEGAPHPRHTHRLIGHDGAAAAFLDAYNAGRLHHAWLITGPAGVGKATLTWKLARFLLSRPAESSGDTLFGASEQAPPAATLETDPDSPTNARLSALSEGRLHLVRRGMNEKGDRPSEVIRVDEIRALSDFLHMSAPDGGRRVVVIDAADEMNASAANALLKMLEEPPPEVVMFLVCHQPARLLPTIRSRCRQLRLGPLGHDEIAAVLAACDVDTPGDSAALAELAGGSAGMALRIVNADGLGLYAALISALRNALDGRREATLAFVEEAGARAPQARRDMAFFLVDALLTRLAKQGAGCGPEIEIAPGESALLADIAHTARAGREWADLQAALSARTGHGRAVNLDPAALLLDTMIKITKTARRTRIGA